MTEPVPVEIAQKTRRAAQYLRVSTDYQRYSIENQAAAIAAYAALRGIDLVATYSDMGRSGLRLEGRDGLKRLLEDVERGRTQFDCILVYDVSRWGRFQDVDESAYYEFICRRAGIQIHYCGDDFENDGTLASVVLKNIKRVAAADYSVQLSKKVFLGQSRTVSQGYWRGASAPYGMRRWLVDERGQRKIMLQFGDRKNLRTERTILRPGPKAEVKAVQRIFELFASRKMNRTEIATEMNAKGLRNARGKPWNMQGIHLTLTNEAYVGHVVYNKRTQKFRQRTLLNPPEMWIRHDHAFEGIISPELFARAQQVMADLRRGRIRSDENLLNALKALLKREGRLTMKLIDRSSTTPAALTYTRRFGTLDEAYRLIGYQPPTRYKFREVQKNNEEVIRAVTARISADLERRGRHVWLIWELHLLTINHNVTVSFAVARAVKSGTDGARQIINWELRTRKYTRSDLTAVIRMNESNTEVKDYYLIPTVRLPPPRFSNRVRMSNKFFGEYFCPTLDDVVGSLNNRIERWHSPRDQNPADARPPASIFPAQP